MTRKNRPSVGPSPRRLVSGKSKVAPELRFVRSASSQQGGRCAEDVTSPAVQVERAVGGLLAFNVMLWEPTCLKPTNSFGMTEGDAIIRG